jgi:hypothetical protein
MRSVPPVNTYFWIAVAVGGWCAVAAIVGLILGPMIAFAAKPMVVLVPKEAVGRSEARLMRLPVYDF